MTYKEKKILKKIQDLLFKLAESNVTSLSDCEVEQFSKSLQEKFKSS